MSTQAERAYGALKLKYHEIGAQLRNDPNNRALRAEYNATKKAYHNAGEALKRERNGR